jgi:hypothetical protein
MKKDSRPLFFFFDGMTHGEGKVQYLIRVFR